MLAYNSAQSKALDLAAQARGVAGFELMRRAGMAAFQQIGQHFEPAQSLLILAGKGNNGGDAWVVAGAAHAAGFSVHLWQVVGEPSDLKNEAAEARDWALAQGLGSQVIGREQVEALGRSDKLLVVDGLLGTGLRAAPRQDIAEAIDWVNTSGLQCVALDLPSGLNADNGAAPGALIQAAMTVSFIGMKLGLLTGRGPDCAGKVVVESLGLDVERLAKALYAEPDTADAPASVLADRVAPLPQRPRTAFKNQFGHVTVLAGDHGGGGAALLAAEAALRTGAGLVSAGTRAEHVAAFLARRPEIMVRNVEGKLAAADLLQAASVVLVGPGLGQAAWGEQLYAAAVESAATGKAFVADADALNLVAAGAPLPAGSVITPHPGEAARLLDCSSQAIEADRVGAVRELAQKYSCIAVLKGAGTLIADTGGTSYVCALGNPGMATAGMGDTLAGIVAGVVAQQDCSSYWVARAVQFHAAAGDLAAQRHSEPSMVAADVIAELPQVIAPVSGRVST